jgi:hypothetical protein
MGAATLFCMVALPVGSPTRRPPPSASPPSPPRRRPIFGTPPARHVPTTSQVYAGVPFAIVPNASGEALGAAAIEAHVSHAAQVPPERRQQKERGPN